MICVKLLHCSRLVCPLVPAPSALPCLSVDCTQAGTPEVISAPMRPNGFGGPQFRPPPGPAALDRGRQDVRTDQAGPSLMSPPGSVGSPAPAQNGWTPPEGFAGRPAAAPLPAAQKMPPGNLVGGFNKLSLNGGPVQYYSKAPIGGGEYVQQHTRQQQPPGPPLPRPSTAVAQPPSIPSRPGFGARGPPAFGKGTPAPFMAGPRPSAPGIPSSTGRPASPSSPNKYASIPMPASPSPTTSARPANLSQQQAAQMPLPPSQPRGLAPPSFNMPQQVLTPGCKLSPKTWCTR